MSVAYIPGKARVSRVPGAGLQLWAALCRRWVEPEPSKEQCVLLIAAHMCMNVGQPLSEQPPKKTVPPKAAFNFQ